MRVVSIRWRPRRLVVLIHPPESPYREEMMFLVTMRRNTVTTKVISRFVSFAMPVKPREPPRVSEILSELSKKTRTSIPNPRVAIPRKSSRSLRIGIPMMQAISPAMMPPARRVAGRAKTLLSPRVLTR
jgi:hypothetical protein